ncbi:MAG: hypothetical protein PHQ89_02640 [Bacilli bacterium]|nr:hypothetical protein [Bacilli bacterium]
MKNKLFIILTILFVSIFININDVKAASFSDSECIYKKKTDFYQEYNKVKEPDPLEVTITAKKEIGDNYTLALYNASNYPDAKGLITSVDHLFEGCYQYLTYQYVRMLPPLTASVAVTSAVATNDITAAEKAYDNMAEPLKSAYLTRPAFNIIGANDSPRVLYNDTAWGTGFFISVEILTLAQDITEEAAIKLDDEMNIMYENMIKILKDSGENATVNLIENEIAESKNKLNAVDSLANFKEILPIHPGYDKLEEITYNPEKYIKDISKILTADDLTETYYDDLEALLSELELAWCGSKLTADSTETCKNIFEKIETLQEKYEADMEALGLDPDIAKNYGDATGLDVGAGGKLKCSDFEDSEGNILSYILTLLKILAPILVIILGVVDFAKAMASSEDDAIKKAAGNFGKRLVAAVILFLIPSIIQIIFSLADDANIVDNSIIECVE